MQKQISKYLPQILALLFIGAFAVFAWTEPSSAPPGGNVPAPINVSTSTQYKAGALGIGGLLRGYSDAIFDGNVGIGTVSPGAKLDIEGGNLDMSSNRIINLADPANPQDAATKNYIDNSLPKTIEAWDSINNIWVALGTFAAQGPSCIWDTLGNKWCEDDSGNVLKNGVQQYAGDQTFNNPSVTGGYIFIESADDWCLYCKGTPFVSAQGAGYNGTVCGVGPGCVGLGCTYEPNITMAQQIVCKLAYKDLRVR